MAQTKVKRHDHMPVAVPPFRGLKNIIQWLRQLLAVFFMATALPVLIVRWVPPPYQHVHADGTGRRIHAE